MKKIGKAIVISLAALAIIWAMLGWPVKAQDWRPGAQPTTPGLYFQGNDPGWVPPGSLWLNSSNGIFQVQTNLWNTNGVQLLSNYVVTLVGGTNFLTKGLSGTNIYPKAGWAEVIGATNITGGVMWGPTAP